MKDNKFSYYFRVNFRQLWQKYRKERGDQHVELKKKKVETG